LVEMGEKEGMEGGDGEGEDEDKPIRKDPDPEPEPQPEQNSAPVDMKMKGRIQGNDDKVHIIVTPVEQEALSKMQERLDLCETLIDTIESCFDDLKQQTEQTKQEIGKKVGRMTDLLKEKEEATKKQAQELEQNKQTALKSQFKCLMDHQGAINNSKQRYEQLIADASKDVHERRLEIVTMCNNVIGDKNVQLQIATSADIKFGFQLDSLNQFFKKLAINDCDQPSPPMGLIALRTSSDSVLLEWKILELAENKPILELLFEVAQLPDTEFIPDKNEKTKTKKKEEKKKGKKKKKDSDDESEESESEKSSEESEESEESDKEDSESSSDNNSKKKKKNKNKKKQKKERAEKREEKYDTIERGSKY